MEIAPISLSKQLGATTENPARVFFDAAYVRILMLVEQAAESGRSSDTVVTGFDRGLRISAQSVAAFYPLSISKGMELGGGARTLHLARNIWRLYQLS